ncbi:histidine kinase 1 isoform X1 [Selaginella moellendorffii]|uniref:histidine kinase 1 isoform X1 n=1 Tax=Selaginella moellendorffii TaxID=88036 RepID=UPI000D1CAB36|nr:histidine kinase 1 isoform X1 [Selaginella moellendorffii]XP_024539588.1 histidine kinase 1 isoform X1 [Selaginella moellendorffii]|eukprot:XP_024539587.1 histidine kinase 1 isoform X1 [Selaginella moellendorffii]
MDERLQVVVDKAQVADHDENDDKEECSKCSRCMKRARLRKWRPGIFRRARVERNPLVALEKCRSSYYGVFGARIAIMLMLAILIGLITILTWHFTTAYATKSIKSLAYSLRVELLKRTISRSWNLISTTLDATTTLANLSDYMIPKHFSSSVPATPNGSHPSHQPQHLVMRNITWAVFSSRQSLKTLSVLYSNGQLLAFDRNPVNNKTYYLFSNNSAASTLGTEFLEFVESSTPGQWYKEELNPSTGQPIDSAVSIPSVNFSDYTGNVSTLKTGETFWHVAVGSTDNECLLSSAADVRHPVTNELMATVVVTSALSGISNLMKDLARNYSGSFYLTSYDGLLLASSSNHSLVRVLSHGPKLTPAVDAQDSVIRDGARWLREYHTDSILAQKEVHAEDVVLGGKKFYIDSFYWNLTGLPLIGVILLPRSYVLGDVDDRGRTTLIILVSVAISILVVGCLLILIFTSGVSTEMKLRSELIKHLHARQRAEASSNYKSQFLANMSHELRTPMAAVIGLLDILLTDACLTVEQIAIVSQIRHCSTALLRLLNNILDLSKVESGKLVLEKVDFNIRHELEAVIDMFSVQCVDIDIVLDLADNVPQMVRGDLTRTVQIFANLIGNSIKFTSSGYITIRGWAEPFVSRYEPLEASGGHIEKFLLWFEVDDSGCGIDPSKWETVFDSFVQADTSTSRTHGGTGLGLCIVRSLVSKMGGEIKVVKKEEPGTLMRFYLMYDSPFEVSTPDNTTHLAQSPSFPVDMNQFKVLIGMKGMKLRSFLTDWVAEQRLDVSSTEDWNSLIEHMDKELPDSESSKKLLVVLDTRLLPANLEALTDHLNALNNFSKRGALVSWVLNHDTPASVKMRIRDKGYSIMANKPLYKSKLFMLLKSLVGTLPDSFCFIPGLQWKDGILGLRNTSVDYAQDTIWYGKEPPKALERLSKRMDLILGEVASHVSQKTHCGDDEDGFSSTRGSQDISHRAMELKEYTDEEGKEVELAAKIQPAPCVSSKIPPVAPKTPATVEQTVKPRASLTGIHILLAEDTPVIQKVAVVLLKKLGATVVAVADGQAAVEAWKGSLKDHAVVDEERKPFDLILMDCQMPRMDGYGATREIRKAEEGSGSHVPIVALTAHAMSSDEERCLEVGMDAYLTKPIDCKLMATTILSLTKKIVWT